MNRFLIALPALALAACNMTVDDANDQVTVEYDQNVAENAAEDVANGAREVAGEVGDAAAAVENEIDRTNVDIDVSRDPAENAN